MEFLDLARQRCTTRGFTDKEIDASDLGYILSAARVAPTACNRQPQRIIVVRQPDGILKVRKAYHTFNSRCVLIVCRDARDALVRPFDQKCSADLDIGIVCDHMMLAARERGIGSVSSASSTRESLPKSSASPDISNRRRCSSSGARKKAS